MAHKHVQDSVLSDPKSEGPKPEFPQEPQTYPGTDARMSPQADHGEHSYVGLGRLTGRKALVTGADSGIGRAIAIAFAREGADVAIAYLEEDADAKETANWVEGAGRRALLLRGDLQSESHCQKLVKLTQQEFGGLDLLVNNAAYQTTHESVEEFTTEELERTFATNVFATFWLCKAALPLLPPGSAIINTTSIQAFDPSGQLLFYAATKTAIANFTKSFSQMAMKQGVRVNAVAPGPVWTPLIPATMPLEKVKKFGKDTAFERPAQPVEIAPIFVFLASNEAHYVSGEIYSATGGQTPY